jgi:TatA/E family protein of Tat protein translocase
MWGLSLSHWIIVIGVCVLLFGTAQLPALGKDFAKTIREILG